MSTPIDEDFSNLVNVLKEKNIFVEEKRTTIKKIHEISYSLSLWSFVFKESDNDSLCFLDELRSDCVQAIPLALMGYKKATSLLLRGIIENSIKHIYFYHHPIEFLLSLDDKKYYITMKDFYNYLQKHPSYAVNIKKYDFTNDLDLAYKECSLLVHSGKKGSFQFYRSVEEIKYNEEYLSDYAKSLQKIGQVVNYMFVVFYLDEFKSFPRHYKDVILRNITTEQKRFIHNL